MIEIERQALQLLLQLTLVFSASVASLILLRPLLRRGFGAAAPYLAWLLLPVALLALALPEPQAAAPTAVTPTVQTLAVATPLSTETPAPAAAALSAGLVRALLALWALGLLVCAAALALQQRRLQGSLVQADGQWRSPAGSSPALIGCWPARLVLPLDFEQRFGPDEQRLVLAHEAVHSRRLDNHWNLLGVGLLALQWFNPLAWWAWRRMRADQEIACDAAVLHEAGADAERARYAQALLKSCHSGPAAMLSSGWGMQHPLLERLRLLKQAAPPRAVRRLRLPAIAALSVGSALLVQAAAPALPTLPAATGLPAEGNIQSELSTPPAGKDIGLLLELRRPDVAHDHHSLSIGLQRGPLGTYSSTSSQFPQDGWCLDLLTYTFPDGQVRVQTGTLDASCAKLLGPRIALPADGTARELTPRPKKPVFVSMRWLEPQSPEMIRMRDAMAAAPLPEKLRAIDEAWQRARGDAANAVPPAPPAAMPSPPLPPVAPRGPVGPLPPPAPPAAPAERTGTYTPETVASASAAAPIRVELALEFEERQGERKQSIKARPTLVLQQGSTGTLRLDVGDKPDPGSEGSQEQLEVSLNLRELGDEKVSIEAQLRLLKSGEMIAKPRLITKNGVKARIETGRDKGPEGSRFIRLDVLPTVLAGQAPPQ